ncbi:MBL fold metallo-hydrolase [Methylobacillus sp. MM3]|uniref:MBL fold metallo-hydrolase n=1 Tax=Methylobacillus sp. MM3 TaxID=1848039 RepID=UPI0007E258B7|nr:MBL fold metallo-hydrolase [Methylobacillus sp. MM3]OAJ69838.1 MBL fold metallo-hydrolase [Methylobacillus sp. MM3]
MIPKVKAFFDEATFTVTYIAYDDVGGHCAVIDSVLDYDPRSGRTSTSSADAVIAFVNENALKVQWLLETHAHADHITAAPYLRKKLGGLIGIGEHIQEVQGVFKKVFNLEPDFSMNGDQFDHLFSDSEEFNIGKLKVKALHVPGHTPADMAYLVEDQIAFVGDTLFMPDIGTARCDFPGGDAHTLYQSVQRLLNLPQETRLYMCHDYPPESREPKWETTVKEEREKNIHIHEGITEEEFIVMRKQRDDSLAMPTLILPSIQINIRAGELPTPESNGLSYLKIPLNGI